MLLPPLSARTLLLALLLWPLTGCRQPSAVLDCTGDGSARGSFSEINSGDLAFKHAVVFPSGDAHMVLFSDDVTLAAVMRASPDPEFEGTLAASMYNRLLVGFQFDAGGDLKGRLTRGNSTSSGFDGGDRGAMQVDDQGCARGDVRLNRNGNGYFAVPVLKPHLQTAAVEIDHSARDGDAAYAGAAASAASDDPITRWAAAHARLMDTHPVSALEALGFTPAAASVLAADPRSTNVLERMRTQCVDPAQARLDEYGDVVGPSPAHRGFVFQSTVRTRSDPDGEVIDNCYVMQRNEDSLEQCWPLRTDCTLAPVWKPTP